MAFYTTRKREKSAETSAKADQHEFTGSNLVVGSMLVTAVSR